MGQSTGNDEKLISALGRVFAALGRVFVCDLRSLALFRIALGVMLLVDLTIRWQSIEAMYTDAGILPRELAGEYAADIDLTKNAMGWSLHSVSGSIEWQIGLFAVAALAAGMLIVGWQTRLAAIISWLLLVSLHARNPLILHSGDTFLKLLAFWAMFLPLGRIWSLDAKRRRPREQFPATLSYASVGTAGLIFALFSLYFFAGIAKWNEYWWSGIAMDYVLRLDIYATGLGKWMLSLPWLLKLICWATVIGEIFVPLLLFVPWRNDRMRLIAMIFFWVLHLSIALSMSLGHFQYTCMIAWFALLPSSFWKSGVVRRLMPWAAVDQFRLGAKSGGVSWGGLAVQGLAVFFLIYSLCWHISNNPNELARKFMPPEMYFVSKWTNMKQAFVMFDIPPQHSPWFVYEARLKDGSSVDIFRNQPVDHERPESVLQTINGHHWRRLHRNLVRPGYERFRTSVAQYVVNRWNASHEANQQVEFMKLTAYLDQIGPNYNYTDQEVQVWGYFGEAAADRSLFNSLLDKMKTKGSILPE